MDGAGTCALLQGPGGRCGRCQVRLLLLLARGLASLGGQSCLWLCIAQTWPVGWVSGGCRAPDDFN